MSSSLLSLPLVDGTLLALDDAELLLPLDAAELLSLLLPLDADGVLVGELLPVLLLAGGCSDGLHAVIDSAIIAANTPMAKRFDSLINSSSLFVKLTVSPQLHCTLLRAFVNIIAVFCHSVQFLPPIFHTMPNALYFYFCAAAVGMRTVYSI